MVIHVLSDGSRVSDITGRIVPMNNAKAVYNLMTEINKKKMRSENENRRESIGR